jgi:hypothetical protein
MDLWRGSLTQFTALAQSGALPGQMLGQYSNIYDRPPSDGEFRSWKHSLPRLAAALRPLARRDIGATVRATASGASPAADRASAMGVTTEYHLPLSNKRIDVLLTGRGHDGVDRALVVELKQWTSVTLSDEFASNVIADPEDAVVLAHGHESLHPSEQARGYRDWLQNYNSAFHAAPQLQAAALAYCHDATDAGAPGLRDPRFAPLLRDVPLFLQGDEAALGDHVATQVGHGQGLEVLQRVTGGRWHPSQRVIDRLQEVVHGEGVWHLLDEQQLAFNAVLDAVKRQQAKGGKGTAIIIRGAPGTGKTVIAVQLLAAAAGLGWAARHSTGGKAFTTAMRSKFRGADGFFCWNMNLRDAPERGLDLLLVDEAHRVRETSDVRWTPKSERGQRSQTEELLRAARVTVFLLDEHQYVRPDEVGSTATLRAHAQAAGRSVKEFDLRAQFRCGGCSEYSDWVDHLLDFRGDPPPGWGERFRVHLAATPEELEAWVHQGDDAGATGRLVAGFCWPWSDPNDDGTLVDDVVIGGFRRPWNRKEGKKQYSPANHPYTQWAETEVGRTQVGCIYSAQGFEFTRVGVIWGRDLVRRGDAWVAQREATFDKPVKAKTADTLRLLRNAYRVLLTRGQLACGLLILDDETRAHVAAKLAAAQPA